MSEQSIQEVVGVKQNEDYCSSCCVCSTLCPYEALRKNPETGEVRLDIEKCQVCGLCYSTCPAKAFDIAYYDLDSLMRYLEKAKKKHKSDTLVVMCKGSAPDFTNIQKLFGVKSFIPLSVPCVGRIPEEVYFKALTMGINHIDILACDEDFCRFERGSSVTGRKIMAINRLLEQLGYGEYTITFKRNSLKIKVDSNLCIACGNCVFYCPYGAAKLGSPGAVSFDLTLCRGCGLCVAMCPALALDLENWERDRISNLIPRIVPKVDSPKILVFRCQWASFPSMEEQNTYQNVSYIDLPCASRVDIVNILEAFQNGIDGVLVAACPEEECKQEKASGKAKQSVEKLKGRLKQIGLSERLHFCTVVPRHPEAFDKELNQFCESLKTVCK